MKIDNIENFNRSQKAQRTFNTRRQNIGNQLKEEPFKQAIKLMVKTQSSSKANMKPAKIHSSQLQKIKKK